MQGEHVVLSLLTHRPDIDDHRPPESELDCIADQIEEDLVDTEVVAAEFNRQIRIYDHLKVEPLFRRRHAHNGDDFLKEFGEIEMSVVDLQLTGLDLGEIENIIENTEQAFSRDLYCPKETMHLFLIPGFHGQTRWVMPIIAFIGVRISWLMLARN